MRDELVVTGAGRESRLRDALATVADRYDLVLIDCPPSLDQLTINALVAADAVLIVTQSKQASINGLTCVDLPPRLGPDVVRVVGFQLMGALPSVVGRCEIAQR